MEKRHAMIDAKKHIDEHTTSLKMLNAAEDDLDCMLDDCNNVGIELEEGLNDVPKVINDGWSKAEQFYKSWDIIDILAWLKHKFETSKHARDEELQPFLMQFQRYIQNIKKQEGKSFMDTLIDTYTHDSAITTTNHAFSQTVIEWLKELQVIPQNTSVHNDLVHLEQSQSE